MRKTAGERQMAEAYMPGSELLRIPACVADPNVAEDLERFQTRKDDVFITSYPKSGMSPNL